MTNYCHLSYEEIKNIEDGFIEGNNNFMKVIKRITFRFRSFKRFKIRIMICKGLLKKTFNT